MKNLFILILLAVSVYGCKEDKEIYPATESALAEIQAFRLVTEKGGNAASNISIDREKGTISVTLAAGISVSHLFPTATISEGAIVQPALGVYQDFSAPVQYTVVAGNRQVRKVWTVQVVR